MSYFYKNLLRPLLFRADAEVAHDLGLRAIRLSLSTRAAQNAVARHYKVDGGLAVERFGLKFANPVGIAAGFDKNGIVVDQLAALGFGFVEIGTVTRNPQPGNARPRMFRLPLDKALLNRLGFNNLGAEAAADRLAASRRKCVIGVNIGRNKDVPNDDAVEDYLSCLETVYEQADYIAVNVSSPNTPGLRELQEAEHLRRLTTSLRGRAGQLADAAGLPSAKPLLLKIAPDLTEEALRDVIEISREAKIDGIIATNTTISREGLETPRSRVDAYGDGGLSGGPLKQRSNEVISFIYRETEGALPIIGVGGIFTAADALEKIRCGASLVQAYTGFVYNGPGFALELNRGLIKLLEEHSFATVDDAVGTAVLR